MITLLSGCDLFMSPIKQLYPRNSVKARHRRSKRTVTAPDLWRRDGRNAATPILVVKKGRGDGAGWGVIYCGAV